MSGTVLLILTFYVVHVEGGMIWKKCIIKLRFKFNFMYLVLTKTSVYVIMIVLEEIGSLSGTVLGIMRDCDLHVEGVMIWKKCIIKLRFKFNFMYLVMSKTSVYVILIVLEEIGSLSGTVLVILRNCDLHVEGVVIWTKPIIKLRFEFIFRY